MMMLVMFTVIDCAQESVIVFLHEFLQQLLEELLHRYLDRYRYIVSYRCRYHYLSVKQKKTVAAGCGLLGFSWRARERRLS